MAAARAGRWDDAAATYTEDAILWLNGNRIEGRKAILEWFQRQSPFSTMQLYVDEIGGRGDMAFVSGHSTITPPGGEPFVSGRYLDIRLRQPDGTWLFYRDMANPTPEAQAAMRMPEP